MQPSLGTALSAQGLASSLRELSTRGSNVLASPNTWQRLSPRTRRYRLNRFPYGLVYAVLPTETVIVAVMHLHRNPGYWVDRLKQISDQEPNAD